MTSVVTRAPGTQPTIETRRVVPSHLLAYRTLEALWAAEVVEVVEVVEIAVAVEDIALSDVALDIA